MTDELRYTALTDRHEQAGAKLAPFAGWLMPLQYTGTVAEHEAVRSTVGLFDVSHLGTVWIEGSGALDTIARTFTNDPTDLADGSSQYTLCCDDRGGIIDDLIVYRLAADSWLAVPNAANTAAVVSSLHDARAEQASVRDEGPGWAILAVQGPDALSSVDQASAALGDGREPGASEVPYLGIAPIEVAGEQGYLTRTGYTGEPGCELVVPGSVAGTLWDALHAAGATPCGLGARDTLRLEMGYPLHGNDLSTDVTPYEARLGWAVKLERDDFRGRAALVEAKAAGPSRRLWGLLGDGRRPPRQGMTVAQDGTRVGVVTSGSFSPTLGVGIGMGYLDDGTGPGDAVAVDIRGTEVPFEVVRPPFVDRDPRG